MTFPIARANKRLTLQEESKTSDGRGGNTVTWVDVVTVWAALEPVSAKERYASEQVQRETTHRIQIRYRTGVHSGMRAKHGNRIFSITGVVDVGEAHVKLQLDAKEVSPPE